MAMEWSPRGDPMLALLPAARPAAFDRLPFSEQQWRGRVFLMLYSGGHGEKYSWFTALKKEDNDDEAKAIVAATPDEQIVANLAAYADWLAQPERNSTAAAT